MSDMTC